MRNREEITQLKLRTTLHELKQFSSKAPPSCSPIGISLISMQPYRSKRKVEQRTNRENIENQLKIEIFKKIRETMQSRQNYNGLEIAKVTMHCNKLKPTTAEHSHRGERRRKMQQSVFDGRNGLYEGRNGQNRCLRVKTENTSLYRPYESTCQSFAPCRLRKQIASARKLRTQRCEEDVRGWNISTDEEDFCPKVYDAL